MTQLGSGRKIDRHNPIITDPNRLINKPSVTPKPYNYHQSKKNKSCNTKANYENGGGVVRRRKSWSCTRPGDFITPQGSSRYLLSDHQALLDVLSDFDDPVLKLVHVEDAKTAAPAGIKTNESTKPPSSSCLRNQVVVLRVSLHCKGCEKKMRKHISRMQGVTSFNIDFSEKKVTVSGEVTPLEVLASISKVKNAQLWTPPVSLFSTEPPNSSISTLQKLKQTSA